MATTVPAMRMRNRNVRPTPRPTLLDFLLLGPGTGVVVDTGTGAPVDTEPGTVRVGVVGVATVGDRDAMEIDTEGVNPGEDDIDGPGVSEDVDVVTEGTMEAVGVIMDVVSA